MKTRREMTLAEALDEIAAASEEIRASGGATVDGQEFTLEHPVVLEIESEAGKKEAELEFEIKFRRGPAAEWADEAEPKRGGRAGFIVGLLAAVAAVAAIMTLRRRHGED
jgi:hypothetical protein